jgi:hypothetical protein
MGNATCEIEDCEAKVWARGWCAKHYRRWQRTGDPRTIRQHPGYRSGVTCLVDDCPERPCSSGYCGRHYMRWKRHGDPTAISHAGPYAATASCLVDDCDRRPRAHGYCPRHRSNMLRYGNPVPRKDRPLEVRLREVGWTVTESGCWEWDGKRNDDDYGLFSGRRVGYENARAHRVMYECFVRSLAEDEILRHTCDNPPCVNPDHLIPGTMADNSRDMVERGRSRKRGDVCANGHDVTKPGATKDVARPWGTEAVCVECARERSRRYVARRRAA